jgi:hypothetical protein
VWLIIVYVALVLVGGTVDSLIGLAVEEFWPTASILVFIFLYLSCLWLAWVLAVRWTEPKVEPAPTVTATGAST